VVTEVCLTVVRGPLDGRRFVFRERTARSDPGHIATGPDAPPPTAPATGSRDPPILL
jgi:hypothetical protein